MLKSFKLFARVARRLLVRNIEFGKWVEIVVEPFAVGVLRGIAVLLCAVLMVVTVAGRVVSGIHWITDIVGGILISASLMAFYRAAAIR